MHGGSVYYIPVSDVRLAKADRIGAETEHHLNPQPPSLGPLSITVSKTLFKQYPDGMFRRGLKQLYINWF